MNTLKKLMIKKTDSWLNLTKKKQDQTELNDPEGLMTPWDDLPFSDALLFNLFNLLES